MLRWNKALWLAVTSPTVIFDPSECFISEYHSYATLKFVYDIDSWIGTHGISNKHSANDPYIQ